MVQFVFTSIPDVSISVATAADEHAIVAFMRGLSDESRRSRFFGSMSDGAVAAATLRELSPELDALSVIARDAPSGRVIGHAIAIAEPNGFDEVAVAVADRYQNRGIGTLLLRDLMEEAKARGIQCFEADILAENRPMLGVFRSAGYALVTDLRSGEVHATRAGR